MARPTKLTPDRRARLLSALRGGNTRRASCQYAGIGESTLADWLKRNRELRLAVEEGQIRAGADLDAIAAALIGVLLLHALTHGGPAARFGGLLDALLTGCVA